MKNLCKISKIVVKAKLWKEWNRVKKRRTDNMTPAEKKAHMRVLKHFEKDLQLVEKVEEETQEKAEDDNK